MATSNLGLKNDFAALDLLPEAWLNDVADGVDAAYANHLKVGITVGAEAANVIALTLQVQDQAGNNVAAETALQVTLVDSASKTADLTASAPSAGWSAATGRLRRSYTANKDATFVTTSGGSVQINIGHATTGTWYAVVELAGRLFLSGAITFA